MLNKPHLIYMFKPYCMEHLVQSIFLRDFARISFWGKLPAFSPPFFYFTLSAVSDKLANYFNGQLPPRSGGDYPRKKQSY